METLPLFFKIKGRRVLVFGTSEGAWRRAEQLASLGASIIHFPEPEARPGLGEPGRSGADAGDGGLSAAKLDGVSLVFAASRSRALNRRVAKMARASGIPVNCADDKDHSSFYMPAIVRRDPVQVAVGSEGHSPKLVRKIRAEIENLLPFALGGTAKTLGAFRSAVQRILPDYSARRRLWDSVLAAIRFRVGAPPPAAQLRRAILRQLNGGRPNKIPGKIYLVGAGPGEPDLLTRKAAFVLGQADVVFCDRLVDPAILSLASRETRIIDAGKSPGGGGLTQDQLNRRVIAEAKAGQTVVRLKSGDPLIFGRAGEELAAYRAAGLSAEIVPGITAALAAAASAQIPLTERGLSSVLTLASGRREKGAAADFKGLGGACKMLAVYMGVETASEMAEGLLAEGLPPATAYAVVANASRPDEKRAVGTLASLPGDFVRERIQAPAVIFIGAAAAKAVAAPGAGARKILSRAHRSAAAARRA